MRSLGDRRDEFLFHMYDAFWSNISRAEDATWKMIAAYSALIAGVTIARPLITTAGAVFLLVALGYIGSCLATNSNLWFRRNLTLIGRLESNFLLESDYGRLIPQTWKENRKFWSVEYWTLLFFAYPVVSITASLILLPADEARGVTGLLGISSTDIFIWTVLIGAVCTTTYALAQWKSYKDFLKKTTTKKS